MWLGSLIASGFTAYAIQNIYDGVCNHDYPHQAGLGAHAIDVVSSLHINTWFTTEGLPNVVQASKGTLDGTQVADIVSIIAICRICNMVPPKLKQNGLCATISTQSASRIFGVAPCPQSTCGMQEIGYVDDGV